MTRIVLVAAVAENGVIGDAGDIPWSIPGEQAQFKALTWGHVLLMGRATYASIGRPLPGRTTVVLTRDPSFAAQGVLVAHSLPQALAMADDLEGDLEGDVMVAGGAQVYAAAMPLAEEQVLTRVRLSPPGDTRYPAYDPEDWQEVSREVFATHDRVRLQRRGRPEGAQRADS